VVLPHGSQYEIFMEASESSRIKVFRVHNNHVPIATLFTLGPRLKYKRYSWAFPSFPGMQESLPLHGDGLRHSTWSMRYQGRQFVPQAFE
jgi:hypothetical protein